MSKKPQNTPSVHRVTNGLQLNFKESNFCFCFVLFSEVTMRIIKVSSEKKKYRISSNKRPRHLFSFVVLRCSAYWKAALKKGRRFYFKVKRIIHMKFQNLVLFSFRILLSFQKLPLYYIFLHTLQLPVTFYFSQVIYLFHIHFNLVTVPSRHLPAQS